MWTDRYHLKMLMEQQLRTARWVSQVVKNKRGNNTGPLTRDSNLLIGGKPKPKPSAPLQRGLPARSVVRYLVRSHPAPPPPRRHLRGPDPSHFDPWWDRSRPPGTWQLGSSHLLLFVWRDQAGADRQSDSGRCLTAVCVSVCVCECICEWESSSRWCLVVRLLLSRDTCSTTLLDASDDVARYDCTNDDHRWKWWWVCWTERG